MILQQNRYHIEDLCDLLIAEAKCHGHPLDPHSWELPDAFFDRYGFLLGEEMLRHRNKIWPKKDEPLQGKSLDIWPVEWSIGRLDPKLSISLTTFSLHVFLSHAHRGV